MVDLEGGIEGQPETLGVDIISLILMLIIFETYVLTKCTASKIYFSILIVQEFLSCQ